MKRALLIAGSAVAIAFAGCRNDSSGPGVTPPPPPPPPVDTIATISPSASAWSQLDSSPSTDGHFQDASFINENEGWVVGILGDVYHTIDGGATWERLRDPTNLAGRPLFRSVVFVSPTLGWVGDLNNFNNPDPLRSLWETRDGGKTFTNISSRITGAVAPVGICGLFSVDASTIYGVGRWNGPAVFVKSTDGGATWQSKSLAPMMTGAVDVYFFDKLHGLIAGARGVGNSEAEQLSSKTVIAMTADGGETWTEKYVGSESGHWAWKISFPTPQIGYIATQGANKDQVVLKTIDGGNSWSEIHLGNYDGGFSGAGFISASVGWVGASTYAYETTDGGVTWKRSSWVKGQSINRFRLLPSGVGYAVGARVFKYVPK